MHQKLEEKFLGEMSRPPSADAAPPEVPELPAGTAIDSNGDPIIVVFMGHTTRPWLRFLAPGFAHCFALLRRGDLWIAYDPLYHYTRIDAVRHRPDLDPCQLFESLGYRAVRCQSQSPPSQMAPLAPFTCVEAVKRLLGIHNRWIITPRQLFRYLIKNT